MNIPYNDGDMQCNVVGVELVQSGIWPCLKLTVVRPVTMGKGCDIYEITVNRQNMAFGIVKNRVLICSDYYPDAGKERSTLPEDIFQQVYTVLRKF